MTETRKPSADPTSTDADLSWLDNDTPVSLRFDDSYFSKADGLEETREVFLSGNGLPDRWQEGKAFTIAELGFGTGLNFYETLRQWEQAQLAGAYLTFVSFEGYPMSQADLLKSVKRWPELAAYAETISTQWPPRPGLMTTQFQNAELRLYVGDAREMIGEWDGEADAWYLDGFSPAKNPEMWDGELMQAVFEHTNPAGTFSTFTSAGWVKRNLIAAGFDVKKTPGFRYKKDRLQGVRPL